MDPDENNNVPLDHVEIQRIVVTIVDENYFR